MPGQIPLFVRFPRNLDFVGRSDDIDSLHDALKETEPLAMQPASLAGTGGIGNTQLAVRCVNPRQAVRKT